MKCAPINSSYEGHVYEEFEYSYSSLERIRAILPQGWKCELLSGEQDGGGNYHRVDEIVLVAPSGGRLKFTSRVLVVVLNDKVEVFEDAAFRFLFRNVGSTPITSSSSQYYGDENTAPLDFDPSLLV